MEAVKEWAKKDPCEFRETSRIDGGDGCFGYQTGNFLPMLKNVFVC
jgi:hypothetical protein